MSKPKPSAVIFAKDIERVASFYAEVASMTPVMADRDHIVLDMDVMQLVIHGIPKHVADTFTVTTPPQVRSDMPVKICVPVTSIAQARAKATELGGGLASKAEEWQARGFKACDGHDPEGNVVQFRESAG